MKSFQLINLVLEGRSPHEIISGAIFDFAGYLTTRDETIKVGASAEASPIVDRIRDWASTRDLSIDDADVQGWQSVLDRVVAGEDPAAIVAEITTTDMIATYPKPMGLVRKDRENNNRKKLIPGCPGPGPYARHKQQNNEDLSEAQSAKKIKDALPVKPVKLKTWNFEFTLQQIVRQTEGSDRELSREHDITQAALGVGYAYETGRLPGEVHLKLRRMNGMETIQLIGEIADKKLTQARVPEYLIKKYSS